MSSTHHHSSSRHHHHHKHKQSSLKKESITFDANIGLPSPVAIVHKGSSAKKVRKHKAKKSSVRKIESFITTYLFLALGVIFIIGSIWWLYDSSTTQGGSLWNNLMTFLFPTNKLDNGGAATDISNPFLWGMFIPFSLGYILLIVSFFIKNIKNKLSITLANISIVYLNIIHLKILYYDGIYTMNSCYPNHNTALFISLFLLFTSFAISYYLNAPKINRIAIPFFYISLFLIIAYFGLKIRYLMPSVLLVSVSTYLLSLKQNYRPLNLWNFIFAWFFIIMIWLRKIVALNTSDYLFSFIVFSSLFYILSQLILILNNTTIQSKKIQFNTILILSINSILLLSMGLFALKKFEYQNYEFIFSFGMLLVNVLFLYFIIKNAIKANLNYFYYSTLFLLSISVALIFNSNFIIIFSAIASISLLIYSKKTKDQISILISLGLASLMFLLFLINWLFIYLPSAFSGLIISDNDILLRGIISGIFVVPILFVNNQILKKIYISFSDDWFKRDTIRLAIRLSFIFSLYLLLFYVFQYIFLSTIKTIQLSGLSWYIFNCIFLIILIYLAGRKVRTIFIISILLFAAVSIFFYPLFVHFSIRDIRNAFVVNHELFLSGFGLHYVAVFLSFYLLLVIYHRIKRKFSGNKIIFRTYYIFSSLIFLFFVLSEYDHFSFIQAFRRGEITQQLANNNSHIPYSILLIISSLLILSVAFVKRFRFVRFIGIFVFSIALLKILLFDFEVLNGTSKIVVSFLLGAILILLSIYYSKFKRIVIHKSIKK